MSDGDRYVALLPHLHTDLLPDGGENKFVRMLRVLLGPFDKINAQLSEVDRNIANIGAVRGVLLTWIAAAIGEPRPPWMSDADLIILIKTRIAANSWDGTIEKARAIVKSLWPSADITDLGGMRMTLTVPNEFLPSDSGGKSAKLYTLNRISAAVRPAGVWLEVLAAAGKVMYWGTPPDTVSYGGWSPKSGALVYWGGNYIITGA